MLLPFGRAAGVFNQLFPEKFSFEKGVPESAYGKDGNRMTGTDGKTGAAADTLAVVDLEFAVGVGNRLHLTPFLTESALFAEKSHDPGFHPQVHCHLAPFGTESHGKLLDGAAESGKHVSFEVRKHQDLFKFGKTGCNADTFEVF